MLMNDEEFAVFENHLLNPSKPNAALRSLMSEGINQQEVDAVQLIGTYFPLRIEIVETGEVRVIDYDQIPNGVAFRVLETNVKVE